MVYDYNKSKDNKFIIMKDKYKNNKDKYTDHNANEVFGPRVPPNDLLSEQALLGAIIIDQDAIHDILDIINEKSFYSEKHRAIWHAIEELVTQKDPIDLVTLNDKLQKSNNIDQIGGIEYLNSLANCVPSSANIKYYANTVRQKELLRRLISASAHIGDMSYQEDREIEEVLEDAEKKIYEITQTGSGAGRLIAIEELIGEAWTRIEKTHDEGNGIRGVPTGFPGLDHKLSGFQKSDLIILAARPSVGKTSLVLDFARTAAVKHNVHTAIFSLEMSKEQLFDRMLSAQSRVDGWKLRTGKLSMDQDIERIQQGLQDLSKAPIFIDDTPANNIVNMRSVIRRLRAEKPIGLIIIDYLQLMGTTKHYDSVVHQTTEISRSLKALAKEFNVPVIALSQLSRNVEQRGGRPRLSDLRDSGSIEQDADVVMFIHREEKYGDDNQKNNAVEILIEKHRNGPTGEIKLIFDDKKTSFVEMIQDSFGDNYNMAINSDRLPEMKVDVDF